MHARGGLGSWALDLPVTTRATAELEWLLDLPFWRDGDRYFALTPTAVRLNPDLHLAQHERMLAADLAFPLDITLRRGRWFVLDGLHRLLKAVVVGRPTVAVRELSPQAFASIAVGGSGGDSS